MKKVFLLLVILLTTTSVFTEIPKRKPVFVISPTTGIFSGVRVGFGVANIYENHVWEMTLNYNNELISHVAGPKITFKLMNSSTFDSIYLQANRFWNLERKKSFLILKIGGFLCPTFSFATDSGTNSHDETKVILLITIGYGYSFNIMDKYYFRPSIDIGMQSNIINAGLAITF